jgi:hypothetical protein
MIAQLPNLFDKNFAIGFFLPAVVFALGIAGLAFLHGNADPLLALAQEDPYKIGAIALIVLWLFAIALLAVHRSVMRLLEGYGAVNPLRLVKFAELRAFDQMQKEMRDLDGEFGEIWQKVTELTERAKEDAGAVAELEIETRRATECNAKRSERLRDFVARFPDERRYVLPTRFGNALRAFEVYARALYGLDAIPAWPRLLAVIPSDYRGLMADAEANVSFWVNLWFAALLVAAVDLGWMAIDHWRAIDEPSWRWSWLVALVLSWFFAELARAASVEWGEYVKSAFDLYRGALARQLGLASDATLASEREMWKGLSVAMIYRDEAGISLDPYRSLFAAQANEKQQ